ncbi:unnamed protein product [Arctia plantaginis]|uniref:Uncharacterized protein n=1 Tax=Arctia plantaginis TaxID=874455 RepID=A0A8S0ZYZ4_ARCPL|nr:unnamed protein product [Arctia plantaginis]
MMTITTIRSTQAQGRGDNQAPHTTRLGLPPYPITIQESQAPGSELVLLSMGVRGSGGVGGGVPRNRPSHVAYYVALVGIVSLLILLLLYFFYFFIKKVKKLSSLDTPTLTATPACRPPQATAPAYPVQPVVREGASEMARICSQVPQPGKGGTIYPTSTSPAAIRTDTGERSQTDPAVPESVVPSATTAPTVPDVPSVPHDPVLLKQAPPVITVDQIPSLTAQ